MKVFIKKLRSRLLISLVEQTKYVYIYLTNKKRKKWKVTLADLQSYSANSLGKDLANFLQQENFNLIEGLESHDVYHVLLGYNTSVEEEVQMQFFLMGNGKKSLYAIGTSFVAFLTMPDQWLAFWRAYQRGSQSIKVYRWDFEFLLREDTTQLQTFINGQPTVSIFY